MKHNAKTTTNTKTIRQNTTKKCDDTRQCNEIIDVVIEVFYPHGENANTFRKEIRKNI